MVILGRHCCLWCHITQQELKPQPSAPAPQLRSLATLAAAHSDFLRLGKGDLNVVKDYFNVLSPPFFNIPLDQVLSTCIILVEALTHIYSPQISIPGLHISLGVFYRLFRLLEDAAHKMDFTTAPTMPSQASQTSFSKYVNAMKHLEELREERVALLGKAEMYDQVITLAAVNQSTALTINTTLITAMMDEVGRTRKEIQDLVSK